MSIDTTPRDSRACAHDGLGRAAVEKRVAR